MGRNNENMARPPTALALGLLSPSHCGSNAADILQGLVFLQSLLPQPPLCSSRGQKRE